MQPVVVRILHPEPSNVGPLESALLDVRARNADRLVRRFAEVGAAEVELLTGHQTGLPFGARVRDVVAGLRAERGLVILGSGAIPLATATDLRAFVDVAAGGERRALANNRYSADILAIGRPEILLRLPDLPGDNALPRWLDEVAGYDVDDLRRRWRLSVDLDSPLDALLVDPRSAPARVDLAAVRDAITAIRALAGNRRAELVVAGRTSGATVRWLETTTTSRTRVLIEERGLRASAPEATSGGDARSPRTPRSILGLVLDDRGPGAFGTILGELGDGAIVDTRVLLAHRLGVDESAWPSAEDRFASDLLLPERIADAWLRAITQAAVDAPIPILLGGHSLVGPGIRLVLGGGR